MCFCRAAEDCLHWLVEPIFKGLYHKLGYTTCTGRLSANMPMNPFPDLCVLLSAALDNFIDFPLKFIRRFSSPFSQNLFQKVLAVCSLFSPETEAVSYSLQGSEQAKRSDFILRWHECTDCEFTFPLSCVSVWIRAWFSQHMEQITTRNTDLAPFPFFKPCLQR